MGLVTLGDLKTYRFQEDPQSANDTNDEPNSAAGGVGLVCQLIDQCLGVNSKSTNLSVLTAESEEGVQSAVFPASTRILHLTERRKVSKRKSNAGSNALVNLGQGIVSFTVKRVSDGPKTVKLPRFSPSDVLLVLTENDYASSETACIESIDETLRALSKRKNLPNDLVISSTMANLERLKNLNDLVKKCVGRTVLLLDVEDIRKTKYKVSKSLSWEKTFFDLQDALPNIFKSPGLSALASEFDVLAIRLSLDGTLLRCNFPENRHGVGLKKDKASNTRYMDAFVYDPYSYESELTQKYAGDVCGSSEVFCSSLLLDHLRGDSELDDPQSYARALVAMRRVHLNGYKKHHDGIKGVDPFVAFDRKYVLTRGFRAEIQANSGGSAGDRDKHTFLERSRKPDDEYDEIIDIAQNVAENGTKVAAQAGFGVAKFGALETVDRNEIENLRSLYRRVVEFTNDIQSKKPLSIAVFGPPGCGKSFSVNQLIKEFSTSRPGVFSEVAHEINVAQMATVKDIVSAFQSVRSDVISGRIPVVFLDEFDTRDDEFLKFFLAPMQDGTFRDDIASHDIGKVIFVFAGGTGSSFENYKEKYKADPNSDINKVQLGIDRKVPDFLSRLSGYLDVSGPNLIHIDLHEETPLPADPKARTKMAEQDLLAPIRRAILFRSMVSINRPNLLKNGLLQIDERLLRTILDPRKVTLRHGARSLEAILKMSSLAGSQKFYASDLPPDHLLNMHVISADLNSALENELD